MLLAESLLGSSSAIDTAYIEDVFSTGLYTGNGTTSLDIVNNIQLGAGATTPGWFSNASGNRDAAPDTTGNVYVVNGRTLVKYNSTGSVLWQRQLVMAFSSQYSKLRIDGAGNICIAGVLFNTANTNSHQLIIIKYDPNGTLLWQLVYGITNSRFDGNARIAVDGSNNIYVLGNRQSVSGGIQDSILIKYNSSGTFQWARQVDTPFNNVPTAADLAVDSSGNSVVAVAIGQFPTLNTINITRIDTNGTALWRRNIVESTFTDNLTTVCVGVDSSGNIYVAHDDKRSANDANGITIRKFNSSATQQWSRSITGPVAFSYLSGGSNLAVDSSERVYVHASAFNLGVIDAIRIVRLNADGTVSYVRSMGAANTSSMSGETLTGIQIDASGNYYVSGNVTVSSPVGSTFSAKLPIDGSGQGVYGIVAYSTAGWSGMSNFTTVQTVSTPSLSSASNNTVTGTGTDGVGSTSSILSTVPSGPGFGGLVWMKGRSANTGHALYDTARGATFDIASNTTDAQTTQSQGLTSFFSNGFSIGSLSKINTLNATYTSWTFREQPRFFDIVTYTGNGANRTIAHNLQSVPGCIIVKRTDATADWQVYHRSLLNTQYQVLNSTAAATTGATRWNSTTPTDTVFSLGTDATVNATGATYVAYLFAHDAGGFGATGTDNVISCGNYTGNGSATGPVVTLGYEPQWLLIKRASGGTGDWNLIDNMRGFVVGGTDAPLRPNVATAEFNGTRVTPTATGFQLNTNDAGYNASGSIYIYIAIRRGPMRTPTTGTSVLELVARTGNTAFNVPIGNSVVTDLAVTKARSSSQPPVWGGRLVGGLTVQSSDGSAEQSSSQQYFTYGSQQFGVAVNGFGPVNAETPYINYLFRRAPGFFDVVCYTGNGSANTQSHNLGVAPEMILTKSRNTGGDPFDWGALHTFTASNCQIQYLNRINEQSVVVYGITTVFSSRPTATQLPFSSASAITNNPGTTYVAYLFASCPGVSRVGTYTGTGATQVINCGFAAGARFVLIKRTDSTGDWYVWDSARGITAGNDPYLLLNSTAGEVTNTAWVDTAASGFELSNAGGNLVNTNGASYIFLAIA